ncbi:MAG: hypothetical protein GY799_25350 [Desulfobulbaceae bacterium]|nr:hypothetical protein [Desulfobulbaceae bacterium]
MTFNVIESVRDSRLERYLEQHSLERAIKSLTKPRSRGKGKLKPAKERGAIRGKIARTYGDTDGDLRGGGGAVGTPWKEIKRDVREYSDGIHEYAVAVKSTFEDVDEAEIVIEWIDPDSDEITVVE